MLREVASGYSTSCVVEGDPDGVNVGASFAVVHDAKGNAHGVTEDDVREVTARKRRIATLYPPQSEEAEAFTELADRAEAELADGYISDETLADLFNLEVVGPVDDGVLGLRTVSIQSLRPVGPRFAASAPPARSFRVPRRRLVRVAPRRRERRATTRRTTRAAPSRPDRDPDRLARRSAA